MALRSAQLKRCASPQARRFSSRARSHPRRTRSARSLPPLHCAGEEQRIHLATSTTGFPGCTTSASVPDITTSNFIDLCKSGFYDGIHFHRVSASCRRQLLRLLLRLPSA